jgi:phosphoglycolate phosphatase
MSYKAILFDFDGTIADSMPIMLRSLNAIAGEFGFKPATTEEIPQLRKLSARKFITKRLRIPLWHVMKLRRLERRLKEEFAQHTSSLNTFNGMADVLAELRMDGYTVGVVSSAPQDIVENFLRDADITLDFVEAGGGTFGKARLLSASLALHGLTGLPVLYVGDELRDIEACRRVGIPMVGVAWGLNDTETLVSAGVPVAMTPQQLITMITERE